RFDVNGTVFFVNGLDFTFARRALTRELSGPLLWAIIGPVSIILAVSGPFDTQAMLPLVPRFLFWAFLALSTYSIGFFISMALQPALSRRPYWQRLAIQGLGVSLTVVPFVIGVNRLVLDVWFGSLGECLAFIGAMVAICYGITGVMIFTLPIRDQLAELRARPAKAEGAPPLLSRLPLEKRAPIVRISAEDHHVCVQTHAGEHWIRMRFSDAIDAAAPTQGLQVHRSHWVARDAVRKVRKSGKAAILRLSHGPDIPVSRGQMEELRRNDLL
ncbi:MAG: LytTR family DNA-binding domain-containing protein, partial [Pseudomonadota bacterium]